MSKVQFTHWYRVLVVSPVKEGHLEYFSINVLGFGKVDAANVAMQTLEPGQMIGSMEYMGTADEYISTCGPDGDESRIWDDDDIVAPGVNSKVPFERKDDFDFIDDPLM